MNDTLVIYKVGTGCITDENNNLSHKSIRNITDYLLKTKKTADTLLISSGAVAAGKEVLPQCEDQQTLAAVGQPRLVHAYNQYLPDIHLAQVLLSLGEFKGNQGKKDKHKHNDKAYVPGHIVEMLSDPKLLVTINENDNLSLYGLTFSDNDELATLLASYLKPYYKKVVIVFMTKTAGVLDENNKTIKELTYNEFPENVIENDKSFVGRGGMHSKVKNAFRCASYGVDTYIASGFKKLEGAPLTCIRNSATYVAANDSPKSDLPKLLKEILTEANKRMK